MEYLLDTINLDDISRFCEYLPISGVTSNPSIVKKEGSIDFFSHMRQIRSLIGTDKTFHIQVTAEDTEGSTRDSWQWKRVQITSPLITIVWKV